MKYTATITTVADPILVKAFAAEDKSFAGRASYTIETSADTVTFHIQANDSVALRTACNAITKLLTVYENVEGLDNE